MEKKIYNEHSVLKALDGRNIPYIYEGSEINIKKGAFILLHGLGVDKNEYLDFYKTLSKYLTSVGYDVIRIDFPAHGESVAKGKDFILMNCVADSIIAANYVLGKIGQKNLNVFGTSFGAGPAVITANFFYKYLKSVTLLAPALSYRELYIEPKHPLREETYTDFFYKSIFNSGCVQINDNVNINWKNALEFDMVNLDYHLNKIANKTAIIHGDKDSMVPFELSKKIAERFEDLNLTIMHDMDHGFMHYEDEEGKEPSSIKNIEFIIKKTIRNG